jgi:Fe-S cluster biogenesis protein NfuA
VTAPRPGAPPPSLSAAVEATNRALAAHAGGIEVVGLRDSATGREAVVRFTGMCTGCAFKPMTLAATVEPMLTGVDGITAVHALGGRADPEAMARARRFVAS